MRYLLLLFLPLTAMAQFGGVEQPFFSAPAGASASWSPTNLTNIRFYWNYSNLVYGASVSNWVESLWGTNAAAQSSATARPTNSAAGVYFDGSNDYLGISPSFDSCVNNTGACFVIFKPYTPASDASTVWGGDASGGTVGSRALFCNTDNTLHYQGGNGAVTFGTFSSGTEMDCLINWKAGTGFSVIYTNGVLALSSDKADPLTIGTIGARTDVGRFYKGYIREVIFLNTAGSSNDLYQLHNYGTNKYGYSP